MLKLRSPRNIAAVFGVIFAAVVTVTSKVPPKPEYFSHQVFDSLLQEHVRGSTIFYEGFACPAFDDYCNRLAEAIPDKWERDERLAFWLNAYNAMTIKAILKRPGIRMVNNIAGFFTADTVFYAGRPLTLQILRDSILRKFKSPHVHFGAMIPAFGAPRPASRAFRAKNVEAELGKIARQYFRTESGCVLDIAAKVLRLTWICKEYLSDFEQKSGGLLAAVLPYLDDKTAAFAAVYKDELTLDFLPFDWRLNARRENSGAPAVKPYYNRRDSVTVKVKSLKKVK